MFFPSVSFTALPVKVANVAVKDYVDFLRDNGILQSNSLDILLSQPQCFM